MTVIVVKQEDVYTREGSKFVRVSLYVLQKGTVVDFRTLKDINEIGLAENITVDVRFSDNVKVNLQRDYLKYCLFLIT